MSNESSNEPTFVTPVLEADAADTTPVVIAAPTSDQIEESRRAILEALDHAKELIKESKIPSLVLLACDSEGFAPTGDDKVKFTRSVIGVPSLIQSFMITMLAEFNDQMGQGGL